MPRPRPISRLALVACALAVCFAARSAPANPDCPASALSLGGGSVLTTTVATFDTTLIQYGEYRASWDLVTGTVSMYQCCSLARTWVQASDAYDVAGVPAGTPVSLAVLFTVDGMVATTGCGGSGCGGLFGAKLTHGVDADSAEHVIHLFAGSQSTHDVLSLPLTIVAGQPERIDFMLYGNRTPGGSHSSEGTGVLTVTGLPAGAGMVSCQGYAGGAVPAHGASWGRVKVIYR